MKLTPENVVKSIATGNWKPNMYLTNVSIAYLQNPQSEQNTEKTEQTPRQQTEEQLLQYKKEELEQMAKDKGIEVKQSMTKAEIVALLLQKE